jgi:hypothetical protein
MSGKRTKQQLREHRERVKADPVKLARRNELHRASYHRLKKKEAEEQVDVLAELLEWCQMRAVECQDAAIEKRWLWACRWVRSKLEVEQERLEARDGG